eukprot:gene56806-biopygen38264
MEQARTAFEGLRPVMVGPELPFQFTKEEDVKASLIDFGTWQLAYDLAMALAFGASSLGSKILVNTLFMKGDRESLHTAGRVAKSVLTGMPAAHMSEKQLVMVPVCVAYGSSKEVNAVAAQLGQLRQAPDLGRLRGRAELCNGTSSVEFCERVQRKFREFRAVSLTPFRLRNPGADPLARLSRDLAKNLASRRQCDGCGTRSLHLKRCNACKSAWYCSSACQHSDWRSHRPLCRSKSSKGTEDSTSPDSTACLATGHEAPEQASS